MVVDQNTTGYRYEKKFVSEHELHTLLLEEQEKAHKQNTASSILGRTDPDLKHKLTTIFKKANKAKVIDCSLESFLYWFGGRPGEPQPTIKWKKKNTDGDFHKSALYYFCKKMNPEIMSKEMTEIMPKEMTEIFGETILTKNKNFSAKNEIDEIFE